MCTESFEIELFICIIMDLVLNKHKGWYAIKPKQTSWVNAKVILVEEQ